MCPGQRALTVSGYKQGNKYKQCYCCEVNMSKQELQQLEASLKS